MVKRLQSLPVSLRVMILVLAGCLVLVVLFVVTVAVAWWGLNGMPRMTPVVMLESYTVREFARLPDDNAYPSALALAADGTLFTGSYVSGTVWQITPDGAVTEIPATREKFGSVTGMSIADSRLYILDRNKPLEPAGAIIWKIGPENTPEKVVEIDADKTQIPYDLAVDAIGNMYITLVMADSADYVARYAPDGSGGVWWTAPDEATITGTAFDAVHNRILVVDTAQSVIYEIPVDAENPAESAVEVFRYADNRTPPGFDGLAVSPNGGIYVAALGLNRVARLDAGSGELAYLAGAFRGSSRVAHDPTRQRLYVNNWDQRSLLPGERILFVDIPINPHLPFTIDIIEPVQ